ncbi:MAG: PQQ-binding-like beta-propeller repeat protein [Fimbriiglobus sp.]|jgi:outer membrane protein assembly factor BamB|nr:PQQ-binding-like beta-propeller repeat protein [Fimbriiglobus sp.]
MPRILPALLLLAVPTFAADWPQFLGPTRDSVTPEKFPAWTTPPKEVWKKAVGEAHSSPVVANGLVYVFAKVNKKEAESLTAFDAKTGDQKWTKSYDRAKFSPPFGNGPRGTPVVDSGRVYTLGSTGLLTCWDAKTGDQKWQKDTLKEFGAKNLFFGVSTSPTVVGKNVIVMVGGKGAGVVAFDTEKGETVWQATDDRASYASPIVVGDKDPELVFLTGDHVRSMKANLGKEVWAHKFVDKLLESSTTPVKVGDLYVAGAVTVGSVGLKVEGGEAKQVWKNEKLTCYFSTPVAIGDYLYMVNGEAKFPGGSITLRCVEAKTGNIAWEKKDVGEYHAALVKTGDGRLLMHDDKGNLKLLEANPKEYKELATAKVCGKTWAHPAVSDGKIYLRDEQSLYCLEVK